MKNHIFRWKFIFSDEKSYFQMKNHIFICKNHRLNCKNHRLNCKNHRLNCKRHRLSCKDHRLSCKDHRLSCKNYFCSCPNSYSWPTYYITAPARLYTACAAVYPALFFLVCQRAIQVSSFVNRCNSRGCCVNDSSSWRRNCVPRLWWIRSCARWRTSGWRRFHRRRKFKCKKKKTWR